VAHAIDDRFPTAPDLSAEMLTRSKTIAHSLLNAKRPAIVSGGGLRSIAVLKAAANIASALHAKNPAARICFAAPESNSIGLGLMDGKPLSEALTIIEKGSAETLIVLENDLFRRVDAEILKAALQKVKLVVLLDHTATAMVPRSDVILPSTPFTESTGTLINNEGRAQKHFAVLAANEPSIKESWRWICDIMAASGHARSSPWNSIDDVSADLIRAYPELKAIVEAAPPESFRIYGSKIARQPHRYSGRTAIHANVTVHEPKPPEDIDSPFSYSMEGFQGEPPAPLIPRFWDPGWNSVQSLNKFQIEVGGPLRRGPAGKKIFASASGKTTIFSDIPPAFAPRADRFLAVPVHHIFGSEELSLLSPGVLELAPRPYVAIHPKDAAHLGIQADETVDVALAIAPPLRLEVRFDQTLPRGIIGLPVGLPALSGKDVELPAWSEIFKQRIAGAA
jgi:NADH-quinone oxidoreductase subunit G